MQEFYKKYKKIGNKSGNKGFGAPVKYAVSFAALLILSAVLLTAACLAVYNTADPDAFEKPASYAALYVSLFISGIVTARVTNGAALSSLIVGAVFSAVLMLVSLFCFGIKMNVGIWLLLHLSLPAVSFVGGMLGKGRERKTDMKSIRKKYKKLSR